MKIVLDLDGVITDFSAAALRAHKIGPEQLYKRWPRGEWDIVKILGMSHEEFWEPIDKHDSFFWSTLPVFKWAADLTDLIAEFDPVYTICTSPTRSPYCYYGKAHWIFQMFGIEMRERLMVGPKKELLAKQGVVLIDDKDTNCAKFVDGGGKAFVFPQIWNSAWKLADADDKKGTKRLAAVKDFLQKVEI